MNPLERYSLRETRRVSWARRDRHRHGRPGVAAESASSGGRGRAETKAARERRRQSAALPAEGEADHLSLHGRRPVASGDVRPQAEARRDERQADARVVHQGPADRPASGREARPASAPQHPFKKFGKSGQEICTDLPAHRPRSPTSICIVRSMHTEAINHDPAHTFMNTGSTISGRPSMGSWLTYGLGSESRRPARLRRPDLDRARAARRSRSPPGSGAAASCPAGSRASSSVARATRSSTSAIPPGVDARPAAATSSTPSTRSTGCRTTRSDDPEIATRIAQYEMAFRMQASVPELMDLCERAASTCSSSTAPSAGDGSFAANCLLARRLAERGVRFIQLYHRDWDHHGGIKERHRRQRAGGRPGLRGPDHGPEAARHARRHAGRLGRRVRPHADGPGATAATTTSRASRSGWPAAASRAASPTARPTSSATTPSRTWSTSTTCTPRCCTCWASTTRG